MESQVLAGVSVDRLEQFLIQSEAGIGAIRANQIAAIAVLMRIQVHTGDGCRSMNEWVASRMDVSPETASDLVESAKRLTDQPGLSSQLAGGEITFDRAVAASRLGDDPLMEYDIAATRRLVARRRRYTEADERRAFRDQYLTIQPSLGEDRGRFHGELAGMAYAVFDKAIAERSDELGPLPDGTRLGRWQRNAHALVAMAHDSLDRTSEPVAATTGPQVTVLVDATVPQRRIAAEVEYGPKVGPAALEAALCAGSVQVTGIAEGRPVVTSDSTKAIPPAVRRYVALRDGGCCAEGCTSRYRLQPHHVRPRAMLGDHDPANLRTLCWFHHHVVVHGLGFRIDPDTPLGRTRFIAPPRRGPP